jgi:hypothetical protein
LTDQNIGKFLLYVKRQSAIFPDAEKNSVHPWIYEGGEAMAYDASKDKVLDSWENDDTGLMVSINRYGEGEPKLQIGPRNYTKKDGSKSTTKAGRLAIDDVLWLNEILDEVKDKLNAYYLDEG